MIKIFKNLDIDDLENEIWKIIQDFNDYRVSNLGRVKSLKYKKERILKQGIDSKGYFQVILCKNKKQKTKRVHILVYETFYNDKLKLNECIHHKDDIKLNNYYENLEKKTKYNHNVDHNKGKNNPFFGKHHLEKTKEIISKKRKVFIEKNKRS